MSAPSGWAAKSSAGSTSPRRSPSCTALFTAIHRQLRQGASGRAADAVLALARQARRMSGLAVRMAAAGRWPDGGRGRSRPRPAGRAGRRRRGHPGPTPAALRGLRDSKQLTPRARERLARASPRLEAIAWAIGWVDAAEIDVLNILQASLLAMRRALLGLAVAPASRLRGRQSLSGPGACWASTAISKP